MKNILCNLCGKDNTVFLFKSKDRLHKIDDKEFNLVQCSNCKLAYLNPQPEPGELLKYYPDSYGPYDGMGMFKDGPLINFLKNIKDSIFKKEQPRKVEVDRSVKNYLDFGCGGGENMIKVKQAHPNWNIEGSDMNPYACDKIRSKGFKAYSGRIEELHLQKEYYDIINVSHVIEHVNDPFDMVKRLKEFLKPGGRLIISTPNFDSFAAKIFKSYWYATDTPRHLFLFSKDTLSKLLKKSGLNIEKVTYNTGPKVAIKSIYYLIGRDDMRISHFLWRALEPFSKLASLWGANSIMTIEAVKNK